MKSAHGALRVLITEDHASTRLGIRQILREDFPVLQAGEAADEAATLALLERERWDLLILDIVLPGRSGVEVLSAVRRRWPALPVLVYSAHPAEEFALHMLRAGANGYLTKERAPEELCQAVRQVRSGGTYLADAVSRQLVESVRTGRSSVPHENLSAREFQVMRLIAGGRTGKSIATELALSQKTVSTYRTRIFRKLGLRNTPELIRYAVRERLL